MLHRLFCLVALAVVWSPTASAAPKLPKIVVLEIKPADDQSKKTAELLTETVMTDLSKMRRFEVLGQSDLGSMLGYQQQKQLLTCAESNSQCLAEIGGAMGTDYLLLGSMGRVGKHLRINLKLLDTKKSKVLGREGFEVVSNDDILRETHKALRALVAAVPEAATPVPAASSAPGKAPSPAGVIAKPVPKPSPEPEVEASAGGSRLAGWLTLGGGAAAVVVGTVLVVEAMRFDQDLKNMSFAGAQEARTKAVRNRNIGATVGIAGLAAAATGTWLLLRSSDSSDSSAALLLAPGEARLVATGRF